MRIVQIFFLSFFVASIFGCSQPEQTTEEQQEDKYIVVYDITKEARR